MRTVKLEDGCMALYICQVCETKYDEDKEGTAWEELPDSWVCPVCESAKKMFEEQKEGIGEAVQPQAEEDDDEFLRYSDDLEYFMTDIHEIARTGKSIIEPMRTKRPVIAWDDVLIKGAQIARLPLNESDPVNTKTVIGPKAKHPLTIETPIIVSHMSFGALSREAKLALARGSAAVKTAMCSGEGGILRESMEQSYKYIFEYVPNRYSVTDEYLQAVDAVEIKLGQSSKPGMGGHLPGNKVTKEIAEVRGFEEGKDIISPAHFDDIRNAEDLKAKVSWLKDATGGKPVGVKIAAGHLEEDMDAVLSSDPDFITIDGRAGATGASPKFIKAAASIPTLFALYRARKYLDEHGHDNVSLIITGSLRISTDIAKALAMGADAAALATASLMAVGCQQFRVCNTGKCPRGIATQDPELRARFDIEQGAKGLENFLSVTTGELAAIARMTGNTDIHALEVRDLCTTNSEISGFTNIDHV